MEVLAANWRLAAVAALFFVGVVARRQGWAGEAQGRALLNFVFNIGLPILVFGADATQRAITGSEIAPPMYLLGAIAVLGVTLAPLAAAAAVRIGLE